MDVAQADRDAGPPASWILGAAAVQAGLLYALYRAIETGGWLAEQPSVFFPLIGAFTVIPALFMQLVERRSALVLIGRLGLLTVLVIGAGAYLGYQAMPVAEVVTDGLAFTAILVLALSTFHLAGYLAPTQRLTYPLLFERSWRNFLGPALAGFSTLLLAVVLWLVAMLFDAIGISFLEWLFEQAWFNFPVFGVTFGVGILTFRRLGGVVNSITQVLRGLMVLLLPLAVGCAVLFCVSLLATGLAPLWRTGNGAGLMLWLLAVMLFMVNAVYQADPDDSPYPGSIDAVVRYGLLAGPVLAVLAASGIAVRIVHYGLSVPRSWALLVTLLLACLAVGYAVAVIRNRAGWRTGLARVNTIMGLALVIVLVLTASPVLDFRHWVVVNQLSRLDGGEVTAEELDVDYLRRLARPGLFALLELQQRFADDPVVLARVENAIYAGGRMPTRPRAQLVYRPESLVPPAAVLERVESTLASGVPGNPVLAGVDLDGDGADEYALLLVMPGGQSAWGSLYFQSGSTWQVASLTEVSGSGANALTELRYGDITVAQPRFGDLVVGQLRLRMNEIPAGVYDIMLNEQMMPSRSGRAEARPIIVEPDEAGPNVAQPDELRP